jgi:flagellar assembly protein FliH
MSQPKYSTSRVIKAEISDQPVRLRYKDQIEEDTQNQAEDIIQEAQKASERIRRNALQLIEKERQIARSEAERIIQEAEQRKNQIIEETRKKTQTESHALVMAEFRPKVEKGVNDFVSLMGKIEGIFQEGLEVHKYELVELALEIARCVIRRVQEEDRDLVFRTAVAAIEKARERHEVTIRVHPEDLAVLKLFEMELLHRFDDLRVLHLEKDQRVDRGGVQVETPSGFIDARIKTQIAEIMKTIVLPTQTTQTDEPQG